MKVSGWLAAHRGPYMAGGKAGSAPDKGNQLCLTKDLSKQLTNGNVFIFLITLKLASALSPLLISRSVRLQGERCSSSQCLQRRGGLPESCVAPLQSLSLCPRLL